MRHNPIWHSDTNFSLAGTDFLMAYDPEDLNRLHTTDKRFLLGKSRSMVESMVAMRDSETIKKIIDIGIYKGGSVALYALLFNPEKLVGIEYLKDPIIPLNDFIVKNKFEQKISNYYDTNQADKNELKKIVDFEFANKEVDLIIDDASHHYPETKASFESLFPILRPGGIYIIEDWGWAHWAGDEWQKSKYFPANMPSLTNLLIEISMLCASRPDVVSSLKIEHSVITVRRGTAQLESTGFELEKEYLNRGMKFNPIM
jgi:SAM-dependent methyltransferase